MLNVDKYKRYQILYKLRDYNYGVYSHTELVYRSPFELLISVLLSARARDKQVNKVTKNLFKVANTPQSMLDLGLNKITDYIRCIGLFNAKAKNIIKTCQLLIHRYDGLLPRDRSGLESLPGVGRKTANIILNIIFGYSTIAVDTHVFRFCNRSKFATGHNVISVEKKLMLVVPEEFKKKCHIWFVRHGRYTCYSYRPNCSNCILKNLCEFEDK